VKLLLEEIMRALIAFLAASILLAGGCNKAGNTDIKPAI
jgi:hypothetical protein